MRRRRISCPKGISCALAHIIRSKRNGYHCERFAFAETEDCSIFLNVGNISSAPFIIDDISLRDMIYSLREHDMLRRWPQHDIISVPFYAPWRISCPKGISCFSKAYHPFRKGTDIIAKGVGLMPTPFEWWRRRGSNS